MLQGKTVGSPVFTLGAFACLAWATLVWVSPATGQEVSWSPATGTLAFTSNAGGNTDLWLQRGRGRAPSRLTTDDAQDHFASWFPNGELLVFQSQRDGQREIYRISVDGSEPTNLTRHDAQDLLPDVSPDGNQIVFFSDRGLEHGPRELPGHLYLMDSDGGEPERLTEESLTSTFAPDWHPDADLILFARDFDGDIDLVVLDLETGRERRLPGTSAGEYGGRFSPDGRRIACHAAQEDGEARIVVMDGDGGNRRELTASGRHYQPQWSPDGRWLVFSGAPPEATQFDLLLVSAAGGAVEPLVATEADERAGSWAPEVPLDHGSR